MKRLSPLPLESRAAPAVVTYAAGLLTLPSGETVTALSGFGGPGDVATDGGVTVVGAGAGGGPVVQVYDAAGGLVSSFYAFGEGFRGGIQVGADDGGIRVVPARGSGGGPVLRTFSPLGNLLSSVWVGPESNRDGVFLGAGGGGAGADAAGTAAGVPLDLSRLGVRLIGPGEPTPQQWQGVRDSLASLPPALICDYLAAGGGIDVTVGPITADPSVSALSGVAVEGWGVPGTYDQISGVSDVNGALVRIDGAGLGGSVDTLLHEFAHGVDRLVLTGASGRPDWLAVWTGGPWPTEYERTDPEEAWAESLARDALGLPQPFPAVSAYFAALKSARRW